MLLPVLLNYVSTISARKYMCVYMRMYVGSHLRLMLLYGVFMISVYVCKSDGLRRYPAGPVLRQRLNSGTVTDTET